MYIIVYSVYSYYIYSFLVIIYIFYTKIQGKTDHECSRTHNYTQRYYFNTTILRTQIPIILALKFQEILKK